VALGCLFYDLQTLNTIPLAYRDWPVSLLTVNYHLSVIVIQRIKHYQQYIKGYLIISQTHGTLCL